MKKTASVQKEKETSTGRKLRLVADNDSLLHQTLRLTQTFIPLARLLADDQDITPAQLSDVLDEIFNELYDHPLTRHGRRLTQYLRRNNLIPNEKTTEKLIQYVVDQVILRSPIDVPEAVVNEFWTFFRELFAAPELKGLVELNLDMLRLLLKSYEPLLAEIINILKETKRITKDRLKNLLKRVRIIREDLVIIRRQIRAIRHVKPFFQTDPKDFAAQARIVARMVREFGPFFIKMAQVAAANADFLPEEIARELLVFQEDVPPMSPEEVMETFQEAFGKSPHQCYFGFDPRRPIKSGSIGSVFLAKKPIIQDGREVLLPVIVKIGRYRLDREFLMGKTALGLTILSSQYWAPHSKLAPFLEALQKQVDEFIKGFQNELNFLEEAQNQERFFQYSCESMVWRVPRVFAATPKVLEMEYIQGAENVVKAMTGVPINDRALYARSIAGRFLYTVLLHIIVYREFHGDLHPGNVLVNPLGDLFLIDWGNCIRMEGKWKPFWDYVWGALTADAKVLTEALINISSDPTANARRRQEIRETLAQTLNRKKVSPLGRYFLYQLYQEGRAGFQRRLQTVMHLMTNTQHLGIVVRSEYLHLLRSLVAMVGTYARFYEDVPRYRLPYDFLKTVTFFPSLLFWDRFNVMTHKFYQDVIHKFPLPESVQKRLSDRWKPGKKPWPSFPVPNH